MKRARNDTHRATRIGWALGFAVLGALALLAAASFATTGPLPVAHADPFVEGAIDPPEGYPKLSLSVKMVAPTLALPGGAVLDYIIQIRNTGAYTAANLSLTDVIPDGTVYNGDAQASVPPTPTVDGGVLTWQGDVGFDSTAVMTFSVTVSPTVIGTVLNTAVISHPLIADPVIATAETVITDKPILNIEKTAAPSKPGANKPLTYSIVVANRGQPADDLPITVIDQVPLSTTVASVGPDGSASPAGDVVTWTRNVDLEFNETTVFTFSVTVGSVPSGTIITNQTYQVSSPETDLAVGEPYTITVVDPILLLDKQVWPDPPGSNRDMTYGITVLNVGSLATGLTITDQVPAGVTYVGGGSETGGIVSWSLPSLDTGESEVFTFTVYVGDVMDVSIVNDHYGVCCSEGVCEEGDALISVVRGPTFEALALLDPIAHKPGGGTGTEVTPTLVVRNLGPGNALDAQATLFYDRISVSANDLYADPAIGTPPPFPDGPECGEKCRSYVWVGDLGYGETITFTTSEGQSTIGGAEGTPYTTTVVVTDEVGIKTTPPVSDTEIGVVTHFANVVPSKSAPPFVGQGQILTYTINVDNRGLTTDDPPVLTDVVPMSTTFVWASHDGITETISDSVIVSWTLPLLSTGEGLVRSFTVQVDDDLTEGTQIVNSDYSVIGYGNIMTDAVTSGVPVITIVREGGLIDSYKEVTPALVAPGPGNVLTYCVHIVNSSPIPLYNVIVDDVFPWQSSTYQRDAVASAGVLTSDIVSFQWTGDVAAFSSQAVTFTVLVDSDYSGLVTNNAVIDHPSLAEPVEVEAVAYVTDQPVLSISKSAQPDPVDRGEELAYTIRVDNLGQQATGLVIVDTIPQGTEYVPGSATSGGQLVGDQVRWEISVLGPGEWRTFSFRVKVQDGSQVVNDWYSVTCAEGVTDVGTPVITRVKGAGEGLYLPMILKKES